MALFAKDLLKSIVLIEREEGENIVPHATGFLIGFKKEENKYFIFLLTNKHVFNNYDKLWLRFDKKDEEKTERFNINLKDKDGKNRWLAHNNPKVDIAMLTISPNFLNEKRIDYKFVPDDVFVYPEKFEDIGVELGDEIFIVGFPQGIIGQNKNYAIVRTGSIAKIDKEKINQDALFIIDGNIFPGNSGGPIFTKPEIASLEGTKKIDKNLLLGIVSSHLLHQQIFYNIQSSPPIPGAISIENSGLGNIVPMNFVKEVYEEYLKKLPVEEPTKKPEA
jgi:V8-like Glu-specific endopeptidase